LLTQQFSDRVLGAKNHKNIVSKSKMKNNKIYFWKPLNYFTNFNPFLGSRKNKVNEAIGGFFA
jgi:hypothetical protein